MQKLKLLKNWNDGNEDHQAGSVIAVDPVTAEDLVQSGIAELMKGDDVKADLDAAIEKAIDAAVEKALKPLLDSQGAPRLQVGRDLKYDNDDYARKGPWRDVKECFADYVQFVRNGRPPERLAKWANYAAKQSTYMGEGIDAYGGFLVPPQHVAQVLQRAWEQAPILDLCQRVPMQSNIVEIPCIVETARTTGSRYGGLRLYKLADENTQISESRVQVGKVRLTLHDLGGLVPVSENLLQDSPISIPELLSSLMEQEIAFTLSDWLINGTGAGEGLGILNANCTVSVTRASGGNNVDYADILNMWSRLWPGGRRRAVWLINTDVLPDLYKMSLTVGTSGGQAVYLPGGGAGAQASPNGTLLGRPIYDIEQCQTAGTSGDIILADFSQMLLGQKAGEGVKFDTSAHLWFDRRLTAFRWTLRADCQPWWLSAITPANGSNTLSPFVVLS